MKRCKTIYHFFSILSQRSELIHDYVYKYYNDSELFPIIYVSNMCFIIRLPRRKTGSIRGSVTKGSAGSNNKARRIGPSTHAW